MSRLILPTRRGLLKSAAAALITSPAIIRSAEALMRGGLVSIPSGGGGGFNNLTNWPSAICRPVSTGTTTQTLSWIGPVGGGPSTASDTAQSVVMTNVTGGFGSSRAGQVISGLNISGGCEISHDNVILRNCKIAPFPTYTNGSYALKIDNTGTVPTGVVVEDCEIDGTTSCDTGIWGGGTNTIFRRNQIHNSVDGTLILGSGQLHIDNWYHSPWLQSGAHIDPWTNDGGQNNTTLRHNWVGLPGPDMTTACITFDPLDNINGMVLDNNYMAGGTHLLFLGSNGNLLNGVVTNNFFDLSLGGGYFTLNASGGTVQLTTISGNTDFNTHANIDNQIFGRA